MSADEATLAATREAAAQVRRANHAAYNAPRHDTGNIYSRCGAVHELLSYAEQLVRVLREQAGDLADAPGLFSDDGGDPTLHSGVAAHALAHAAGALRDAAREVNDAWSALSHLGIDPGRAS